MVSWKDFYSSASIGSSSSNNPIDNIQNKLFLQEAVFTKVKNAIRVRSDNTIESLVSECIFTECYSDQDCGVLSYHLNQGSSVIHNVCGNDCYSDNENGRAFGYCMAVISNQLNFSSFLFCPSSKYKNIPFGSITIAFGPQIGNNINSSHNYGSKEGCIIFDNQKEGSRISYTICADSHTETVRSFFVGKNVLVVSSTVIRCKSKENLVHFSGPGEIMGINIIDCISDYSIGCAIGVSKAYDIFINNGLTVDEKNIIVVRQLTEAVVHPHLVLRTFRCWDGDLFKMSECHQMKGLFTILSTLIEAHTLCN